MSSKISNEKIGRQESLKNSVFNVCQDIDLIFSDTQKTSLVSRVPFAVSGTKYSTYILQNYVDSSNAKIEIVKSSDAGGTIYDTIEFYDAEGNLEEYYLLSPDSNKVIYGWLDKRSQEYIKSEIKSVHRDDVSKFNNICDLIRLEAITNPTEIIENSPKNGTKSPNLRIGRLFEELKVY